MSAIRDPHRDQPLPTPGQQSVQDALIRAVQERRDYGIRKYGRPLETHNGRDALTDAWEEALDLVTYLTQMRLERGDDIAAEREPARLSPAADRATDVQPVCKFDEGCHRVVACEPGCAVTAARMYAQLAAASGDRATLRDRIAEAIHADLLVHKVRRDQGILGIVPRLADAVLAVLPAPADRAALERARGIARRLAAHAVGFKDVLDDSDRGPWGKTVGTDIAELIEVLSDQSAAEAPEPPAVGAQQPKEEA